jgi:hypothetical protein
MVCPHCGRTIGEQDRHLMSTSDGHEWPRWAAPALWTLLFMFTVATLTLFSHVFAS